MYIPFELWLKSFCATKMKLAFCPIACHWCLELPFVNCIQHSQAMLEHGYVSLLTFFFNFFLNFTFYQHAELFIALQKLDYCQEFIFRWAMWPTGLLLWYILVFFNYIDELVVNFECDDIPFLFELKLLDFEKILGFCLC